MTICQQQPRFGPKCDFIQLWPWKVKIIHEVNNILHCNPHTTHEHTCEVLLRSYQQFLWKTCAQFPQKWPGERRKNIRRNSLTDVDTLWRKLHHEGEIWLKSDQHMIWRSFLELSFGISWDSIDWAVIEIEPPKVCLKSTWIAIAKQDDNHHSWLSQWEKSQVRSSCCQQKAVDHVWLV